MNRLRSIANPVIRQFFASDDNFPDFGRTIFAAIDRALRAKDLPGGRANHIVRRADHSFGQELRVGTIGGDKVMDQHRDGEDRFVYKYICRRSILHQVMGNGTIYFIGPYEETPVMAPPGTTASHIASRQEHIAAWHCAQNDANGRALLCVSTAWRLLSRTDPWRITTVMPANNAG